mmetsp:Transcript_15834/g.22334  ORF Transcript_15834/g.22334 Transcript_15834/m.22334 type:complete len:177 (-) Transcript_15834:245-775(-)
MMRLAAIVLAISHVAGAFMPVAVTKSFSTTFLKSSTVPDGEKLKKAAAEYEEPRMNPDRPELPELKGDFDWDAKFGGDDDWIVDNVPGKIVMNEIELASQVTALTALEEKWRKERVQEEYDAAQQVGWSAKAETMNGRFAMFFLVVGLLTELWTGVSIPGQIEQMLRVGGVIGFEG